ncbi:MAG: SDR family oxidoreductase [Planctomycetes bacterium]|nr:SDR family oxidoreductase [Planctomycetota bacterium]
MTLENSPVALITGAGSGIGRAISLQLAGENHRLALVGRTESKLRETRDLINDNHNPAPEILIVTSDLGASDQPARIVEQIMRRFGRVDVLINNAASGPLAPVEKLDEHALHQAFEVNLFGPMRLISCLWPVFLDQGAGCVVNISSMATVSPFPGLSIYAASKSGLESMTRSIHNEGADQGITAYSIAPGAVETSMLRNLISREELPTKMTLSPEAVARVVVECVLGRRAEPAGSVIVLPSPQ